MGKLTAIKYSYSSYVITLLFFDIFFFAVTWNFDVAVGDLGFNLMYPPYVPAEYTAHTEGTLKETFHTT